MRGGAVWRRGLAAVAASAFLVTAAGLPAVAVDNYPDEPSEAAASVLAAELMQQELLGAATSDAGSVSNPGPNTENLDVDVLGSQVLELGDIQLPVDQFLDFGQIGALASTSEASGPADAHAVSGLLGADGGVTLDGAEDAFGTATIDVLSLADLVGVDGITDAVVDELTIELGALGAEVTAEDGVILDPDGGVTGPGRYRLGDGTLLLHSPVVEGAAESIYDIGGAVDTQVETLVNDTLDISALTDLLAAVPGIPEPTVTVDSNMQETLFQSVVGEPITSANQLVTIDLSTGELQVHLEHLVEGNDPWGGGDDVGMNGLAPNYEVLDDQTYPQIAEGVHEIMQEATRILIGAIEDSLNAVTINIAFYDESPLGTLDVSWSVPLADAVNGDFPQVVNNSTGTQAVTGALLATTINGLGNTAAPIFGAVYDLIISDAGDQIFELLINDLKTGITSTIGAALSPVFDIVVQFVSLQINHQETATCTTAADVELLGQLEVSALSLGLVQSADAGRIGLGNAGVRIDACDLAAIAPTLAVDPGEVAPGGTTTVTGEGYTPDSTVTVQLTDADGNPVGDPITVDTDETGAFTTPLVVPEDAEPGDFTVVGTDDTTGTPAEAPLTVISGAEQCESAPALTVTPSSTGAGTDVTVAGTGFPAGVEVALQLTDAEGNPVGEPVMVTPDDTCSFTTDYTVPEGTEPGDYEIVAEPEDGSEGATAPLTVEPTDGPTITVDPAEAYASDEVTVTGTGYTPSSTVDLEIVSGLGVLYTAGAIPTDEEGGFEYVVPLPDDSYPTDYVVTGTDAEDLTAETDLVVLPLEPTLTVDPSEAYPGDEVTVTGEGYTPSSTVDLEIVSDLGVLYTAGDIPTDENGGFEYVVPLPDDSAPTDYVATGTDFSTDVFASDDLVVLEAAVIDPSISVAPAEVAPGGTTTVTGEGYTPDATVTVQLTDADGNPVGDPITVDTDETGAFTTPLVVPEDAEPGDFTVVGTDDTTGTPAEAPLTVTTAAEQCESAPAITVAPSSVPAGETVTVVGTGFPAGVDVTVQLFDADGEPVGEPVTVTPDEACAFATDYTVPEGTEPGDYEIGAEPEDGSEGATAPLTVEPADITPSITVAPAEVAPGGTTTVTGEGYTPDSTVTVQLTDADGNPVGDPITVDTDETGAFTTPLVVPEDAVPGEYTVVGIDDTTGEAAEAPLGVGSVTGPGEECTDPTLVADPTSVEPGGEVAVTGTGFPTGVEVSVTLTDASGEPVGEAVTVTPDESCGFTVTITIPDDADPGVHVIVAEPEDGSDGAEVPITVTAPGARTLTAWFEEDSVAPGASQTLYASGFEPGEMVVGVIRSTSVRLQAAAADETGTVEWTFVVPTAQKAGSYIGTATSETAGDSAAASFTVAVTTTGGGTGDGDGNGNGNGDGKGNGGDGNGSGSGDGSGSGSGGLATTGADAATLVTVSMLLLGAGALLIRRRRELAMAAATAAGRMPDEQ